jgi:hypothetical protein
VSSASNGSGYFAASGPIDVRSGSKTNLGERYGAKRGSSARLALHGAVAQLLRKALAVSDARGKPDDFIDLEGVMSWIKSLSASVSNGLRNILKFGAVAASL